MATYVMSDIHGCFSLLEKMLNKINFTEEDQLIIAGDYIDRGIENKQMLDWILNISDNILLLKGNHDAEFAYYIYLMNVVIKKLKIEFDYNDPIDTDKVYKIVKQISSKDIFDYYGTLNNIIRKDKVSMNKLIAYMETIDKMPYIYKLTINKKKYIIVHAGYITENMLDKNKYKSIEDFYLYARDDAILYGGNPNSIIISGHTPTIAENTLFYNNGFVYEKYDKKTNCRFLGIDCGCSYCDSLNSKLAAIRLEDEKIFYTEK